MILAYPSWPLEVHFYVHGIGFSKGNVTLLMLREVPSTNLAEVLDVEISEPNGLHSDSVTGPDLCKVGALCIG